MGITGIAPIGDSLNTETVEIELTWEFQDLAFSTQDGRGIHLEEEVDLSRDDLLRFCGYNISLNRIHKREFITVIFVKNSTNLTEIKTEQLHFKPIVIQCTTIDADAMLDRLKNNIASEKPINELEAVYLPLFSSAKFSPTELFLESAKLIRDMQTDDQHKRKISALLIAVAGKIVDSVQLDNLAEEVSVMGNVIIEYFEKRGIEHGMERGIERGAERCQEEIAKNLLFMGMDALEIIKATDISAERLIEIRNNIGKDQEAV